MQKNKCSLWHTLPALLTYQLFQILVDAEIAVVIVPQGIRVMAGICQEVVLVYPQQVVFPVGPPLSLGATDVRFVVSGLE